MTVSIAVTGASGRMGKVLIEAVAQTPGAALGAATVRPGNPLIGQDAGLVAGVGVQHCLLGDDLRAATDRFAVVIDFTSIDSTLAHLAVCRAAGRGIVIGTTGFSAAQKALLHEAAREIPIVFAPNMSIGVNVLITVLKQTAALLG